MNNLSRVMTTGSVGVFHGMRMRHEPRNPAEHRPLMSDKGVAGNYGWGWSTFVNGDIELTGVEHFWFQLQILENKFT